MIHERWNRWATGGLPLSLALHVTACATESTDSTDDAVCGYSVTYATSESYTPTTGFMLVSGEGRIDDLVVDAGRAYWFSFTSDERSNPQFAKSFQVRQCDIANCAKTLRSDVIWAGEDAKLAFLGGPYTLRVSANRLFLTRLATRPYDKSSDILHCPKRDCGKPSKISLGETGIKAFVVDADRLVFITTEQTLLTCAEANCDGTLERVPLLVPSGEPAFAGANEIAFDTSYYYLADVHRILRVVKDGSQPFEVIAHTTGVVQKLAVNAESVFWTERLPAGVRSCPKSGCTGKEPMLMMEGIPGPLDLVVQNDFIYVAAPLEYEGDKSTWVYGTGRVFRCAITGCSTPEQLYDTGWSAPDPASARLFTGRMLLDAENIYLPQFSFPMCLEDDGEAIYVTSQAHRELLP